MTTKDLLTTESSRELEGTIMKNNIIKALTARSKEILMDLPRLNTTSFLTTRKSSVEVFSPGDQISARPASRFKLRKR